MEEKESYRIFDIKEADPQLEKHRKDVLEKYLEYEFVLLKSFNEQGKTLVDVIDQIKTILWFVKNERMQHINNEFGL
jgi:hypothetical protein